MAGDPDLALRARTADPAGHATHHANHLTDDVDEVVDFLSSHPPIPWHGWSRARLGAGSDRRTRPRSCVALLGDGLGKA